MKLRQRRMALFLISFLMLAVVEPYFGQALAAEWPQTAYGQVVDMREMEIGPGAKYTWYDMKLPQGPEKVHFVEFNPQNPFLDLQPGLTDGKVYGMQGVTKMATDADKSGNRVIAAINGDFYDMTTGVPLGLFMGDGKILVSPPDNWYAFGMKYDGTTIYGSSPKLTMTLTNGNVTEQISHINRMRFNGESLILYTHDFYTSTMTNDLGDEVVLDVLEGEVKSGQTLKLRVAEIHKNKGNTPLREGQVVLSASGKYRNVLAGLQIGDELTASFELDERWKDVKMAIGGVSILVKDGVVQTNPDKSLNPRTAIGTKADGSVVMIVIDGRAPGFSEGVSFDDLAKIMKDIGVVDALCLDGGGSSTFVARLPGEATRKILNRPSDGNERKTANGILLVNKAPESEAAMLVVQPNMERVLTGSSYRFKAAAVDANFHPVIIEGTPSWSVDPAVGTIDGSGQFTAGETPGFAQITAWANGLMGKGEVEVVDELTELKFPDKIKAFAPGSKVDLTVTALRNGQVVHADNSKFEWRVEGPIGTVDANGTFTATNENEKSGKIYVKFKDIETSMDVQVGLPPVILEDFEDGVGRYLPSAGARFKSVYLSEETNEDFVRFGNRSAKLEYDFSGSIGTSGAYIQAKDQASYIEIPGYPEKISMWVYGDGKGHWLRAQLRDGNNAAFPIDFNDQTIGVDFVGWRYLEAEVPKGKPLPLKMDMPVRYMETNNSNKNAGVIYIDQIRALYGPANDDMDPPIIKNISPAEGSTVKTNTPKIQAYGEDFGYDPASHPGNTLIDPEKIRFYVDGERVQHGFYPPLGQIYYTPAVPMADGVHAVKIIIRDFSGNRTEKEWTFNVDTGSSKIVYNSPQEVYAGDTYTLNVRAVKAEGIRDGQIEFAFDPTKVDHLQVVKGEKLAEHQLQATILPEAGTVRLEFRDLNLTTLTDTDLIGKISYRVKPEATGTNRIVFKSGAIRFIDTGDTSFVFYGLPVEAAIKHHLQLNWNETGIVQGYVTSFTVTDEFGTPVEGAKVVTSEGLEVGVTDAQGKLETDILTKEVKEYNLQAVKERFYSPVMTFKVSPQAGTLTPYNISVTMGADPATSKAFTWHTHPSIKDTVVEIVKGSSFTEFDGPGVQRFVGSNYLFNTWDIGTVRVHKATAEGLEPGTEYIYRVGDGNGNYSEQGRFKTAAESGESFKFIYFADSQATNEAGFKLWGDIARKAMNDHPDAQFLVHVGDMVEDGFKENEWNMWFKAAQQNLMNTTVVTMVGNHEVTGTKKNDYFLAHFNHPQNGVDSLKGSNYSFDYMNAHIAVLNSEYDFEQQRDWLEKDLGMTDKKWKIVAFHRGPYGSIYDTEHVRNLWVPVLDQFHVDLVINGHDHVYMRTYPMKENKRVEEGEGTTYVIAGSSGPKFYPVTERSWQRVTDAEQVQMYAVIEINGDELRFVAKTKSDRIVDQFVLRKRMPESVVVDKPEVKLAVGQSVKLNASVLPEQAYDRSVTWTVDPSSSAGVVSVTDDGLVTALMPGTAVVRASSVVENVYAESRVTVEELPETQLAYVELQGKRKLHVGDTDQVFAEAVYSDGSRVKVLEGVEFSSSDPGVASIDRNGLVSALDQGNTVISATYGGLTGSYMLQVLADQPPIQLHSIRLEGKAVLRVGESDRLRVMALYSDTGWREVESGATFASDNEAIASVDRNGTVVAKREGWVRITATYGGLTDWREIQIIGNSSSNDDDGGSENGQGNTGGKNGDQSGKDQQKTNESGLPVTIWTEAELRSALKQNLPSITLGEAGGELRLPVSAAAMLGEKQLTVTAGRTSLIVKSDLLKQLVSLLSGSSNDNQGLLSIEISKISLQKGLPLTEKAQDRMEAKLGEVDGSFRIKLAAVTANNVKVELSQPQHPIPVSIHLPQQSNSHLIGLYAIHEDGNVEFVSGRKKGDTLAAALLSGVEYALLTYEKKYEDVSADHWARRIIEELTAAHIAKGTTPYLFEPNRIASRAEFVSLIARMMGLKSTGSSHSFADIDPSDWYAQDLAAAKEAGIVYGLSENLFKPKSPITRAEMIAIVIRAYELINGPVDASEVDLPYYDAKLVPDWAQSAMKKAQKLGLINGYKNGAFRPQGAASRAECAKLILQLWKSN